MGEHSQLCGAALDSVSREEIDIRLNFTNREHVSINSLEPDYIEVKVISYAFLDSDTGMPIEEI